MSEQDVKKSSDEGISKVKLAVGAASLFLFIIGVKRTFQMDQTERSDGEGETERPGRAKKRKKV